MIEHADGEAGPDVANWFSAGPRHFQSLGQHSVAGNVERSAPMAIPDNRKHVEYTSGENGPDVANWFETPTRHFQSIGNKIIAPDENQDTSVEKPPPTLEYHTNTILDLAVAENDIGKVTSLLHAKEKYASVDMSRQSDMYYNAICRYTNTEMLRLLLENGVLTDVNHIFPSWDKV